ncbi:MULTISPECIES: Z-ring associated ZapG family protein [Nitrincola]|uniref:Z-ring associated protein G n=1 Tax=Nitrincola nitratireducens TaxID=1229521 RepID=W9VQL0_9GAMM|nr:MULTISPECIES: DUF1043 family protein [Nitrincola]EXJ12735.1 Putative cytochrome d ubiquinol oxidase subunit 3 [Nitrincola nitratireducens]
MEQETIWIITLIALVIGAMIGYMLGFSKGSSKQKIETANEIKQTKTELHRYKQEVTSHFETTAELVNNLTEQYRKVHEHLASGAQTLCPNQAAGNSLHASLQPKQVEALIPDVQTEDVKPPQDSNLEDQTNVIEPPRDYAPKAPNEEGTLSSSYGLKKKDEITPPPQPDPGLNDEGNETKR